MTSTKVSQTSFQLAASFVAFRQLRILISRKFECCVTKILYQFREDVIIHNEQANGLQEILSLAKTVDCEMKITAKKRKLRDP